MKRDTTPVVDAIGEMAFVGNTVPHAWLQRPEFRFANGKLNAAAVFLLADCVYWYRPVTIRDTEFGNITLVHKKFREDKWRIYYSHWAEGHGFTTRQVRDATTFLVEAGLITREVRSVLRSIPGGGNIPITLVYLEPVIDGLKKISQPDPNTAERRKVEDVEDVEDDVEVEENAEEGGCLTLQREGGSRLNVRGGHATTSDPLTPQRDNSLDYLSLDSITKDMAEASPPQPAKGKKPIVNVDGKKSRVGNKAGMEEGEVLPPRSAAPPKIPASVRNPVKDLLAATAYEPDKIPKEDWSYIGKVSDALLSSGFTLADITRIIDEMKADKFWADKLTIGNLRKQIPTWDKTQGTKNAGKRKMVEMFEERRKRHEEAKLAPPVEATPETTQLLENMSTLEEQEW